MSLKSRFQGLSQGVMMKMADMLVNRAALIGSRPEAFGAYLDSVDGRLQRNQGGGRLVISTKTLYQMAHVDPVTFSIINRFKTRITKMPWSIAPDTDAEMKEIQVWERTAAAALSEYAPDGYIPKYEASSLNPELADKLRVELLKLNKDMPDARKKARWLFEEAEATINGVRLADADKATQFLMECNQDSPTPFKDLLEAIVDDLCMYDAGAIIKRRTRGGAPLEMYSVDGSQIVRYRNPDYSTPQPPYRAYGWEVNGRKVADFTTEDLLYMMANPQHQGYGFSPLEAAVHIIMGSLYAETYNLDAFRSQIPPAIMNLGPVNENSRIRFRQEWANEVMGRGGVHRLMFINVDSGKDGKQKPELIPMDNLTQKEMEFMKYLQWTLAIKCMCFQVSPQDIGFVQDFHRTTAEVQRSISAEGVQDMASLVEGYLTADVIKKFMGLEGICFKFEREETGMDLEKGKLYDMFMCHGAITRNEVRAILGLRPMAEGGDDFNIVNASGLLPVDQVGLEDEELMGQEEDPNAPKDEDDEGGGEEGEDDSPAVEKFLRKTRGHGQTTRAQRRAMMRTAKANRKGLVDRFAGALKADAVARAKKAKAALSRVVEGK